MLTVDRIFFLAQSHNNNNNNKIPWWHWYFTFITVMALLLKQDWNLEASGQSFRSIRPGCQLSCPPVILKFIDVLPFSSIWHQQCKLVYVSGTLCFFLDKVNIPWNKTRLSKPPYTSRLYPLCVSLSTSPSVGSQGQRWHTSVDWLDMVACPAQEENSSHFLLPCTCHQKGTCVSWV